MVEYTVHTQTYPCDSVFSKLLCLWFWDQQLLNQTLKHRQPRSGQQLSLDQNQQMGHTGSKSHLIRSQSEVLFDQTQKTEHIFITIVRVIPEWIRGNAAGPAGPSGPTQRGPFYDLGWRNGSRPSLLLDHKAHPGHRPPSQAGPFLLRPERDYRTEHLEACEGRRRGWWSVFFVCLFYLLSIKQRLFSHRQCLFSVWPEVSQLPLWLPPPLPLSLRDPHPPRWHHTAVW